ncbi:flagellar biosynthesis protein FlgA [Pseudofrankia sp. DC12]|uniref:flagellar biosynthesis protein FlgA n=1 Tax=Pseudofrankia sp. DC12 TaxID=683315 RepID=UPI0012F8D16B|nr:flagellar biosynthesis protein FlgA [Pseudofrankia sp. DC12]
MTYAAPRRWDLPAEDGDLYGDAPVPGAGRGVPRWGGVLAGLLLAALGAGLALWLGSGRVQMIDAVALSRPVQRGQVVGVGDLAVVRVAADGGQVRLASPAAARHAVVGRQALVDLPAGTLLSPELVGSVSGPAGTLTLGVAVDAAGLPSAGLRPGDVVDVVGVDAVSKEPLTLASMVTVTEVHAPGGGAGGGNTVVYLAVDAELAPQVAAAAAQGPGVRLLGVTGSTDPGVPAVVPTSAATAVLAPPSAGSSVYAGASSTSRPTTSPGAGVNVPGSGSPTGGLGGQAAGGT